MPTDQIPVEGCPNCGKGKGTVTTLAYVAAANSGRDLNGPCSQRCQLQLDPRRPDRGRADPSFHRPGVIVTPLPVDPTGLPLSGTSGGPLDWFLNRVVADVVNGPAPAVPPNCETCGGDGTIEEACGRDEFGVYETDTWPCPDCDGTGDA